MKHHEDTEQALVFEWASYRPILRFMFSIPNGSYLAGDIKARSQQMTRLKKQGLKTGVSDIFLPIASKGYHGMFIEMKRRKVDGPSKVSPDQDVFLQEMHDQGYEVEVCYGAEEAIVAIQDYLGV